jgi:Protein of unknown function (DUF2778)
MALNAAKARNAAKAKRPAPRSARLNKALLALTMVGASLLVAAWITDSSLPTASAALPVNGDRASFEDRFLLAPMSAGGAALRSLKRSVMAKTELELSTAQETLASRWMPEDFRPAISDDGPRVVEARPTVTTGIPLPRSRPVTADQMAQPAPASGPSLAFAAPSGGRPAERSFMQKLSDMMPGRFTMASLNPGVNLLGKGPDLSAFGYDGSTAVYDISAHAVYLPSGTVFEAHSGMGSLRDDPEHVSVPNLGATPPATYSLKPREREFHGVAALRMTPAEGSDIGGRSGLLVHSFMLGPGGDSNGCISVKDYDRFLKAFNDGQFNHIVVVPSLKAVAETIAAAQNDPT